MSHADALREQRDNVRSPYSSPKKKVEPMKEKYQDFTVKMGIVKPEDSDLN